MLFALLGLHAVLALAAPVLTRWVGRRVFLVGALAPGAMVVYGAVSAPGVLGGDAIGSTLQWAPSLGLDAGLRLDAFGLLMVGLVSGIGVLVFVYAYGYFGTPSAKLGSFAGLLIGFAGSMLGLVLSDNLLLIFVFWELTSITSFLLIGFDDRAAASRDAAQQALLTTGLGGLALLGGVVLIGQTAGTYSLTELAAADIPATGAVTAGLVALLLGCFTKSAQVPFHTWLPGAMAAPTPVSAYLHSATMVKAGVYLVARLAPIFVAVGIWRPLVLAVGLSTMIVGAYRALRQHDLKLLIAFGTISQLGFLIVLLGFGTAKATFAGVALLLSHGLFKAALFMVVGVIEKKAGTRDLRRLAGLRRGLPATLWAGTIAAASMAGLPPLLGFIAKEAAYEALLLGRTDAGAVGLVAIVGIVAGSILTFAYSARFVAGMWGLGVETQAEDPGAAAHPVEPPASPDAVQRAPWVFAGPALLLAVVSVLFGLLPLLADTLVNAAAVSLDPRWEPATLELWHGFNLALGLSGLTVAAGGGLYAFGRRVSSLQDAVPVIPGSKEGYDASVRGLLAGAKRLTGVVQNGSLPVYQTVILLTLLCLPGVALVRAGLPLTLPAMASNPVQAAVAALVVAAALAAVASPRRFPAVLLLGAVGYGVAVLFVIHGAPDLALTQLLIETLSVVIFVLVLRHLPERFTRRSTRLSRTVRAGVAAGVGVFVAAFALIAGAARTADPVSGEYLARALPEAEGRNVVNVILVDFRALDTLGEIVVLVVAGLGIASLVLASRLDAGARAEADGDASPADADEEAPA